VNNRSTNRRDFLILGAGGAAVVATGIELIPVGSATAASAHSPVAAAGDRSGSLVAHVKDLRGDTVSLLVGEEEYVVHDAELVARLSRAAR
jgi:Ubiquitinol-cytochrome C reductase Fe-S subunit TAT signal